MQTQSEVWSKIEKHAVELIEKDRSLTQAQAVRKVLQREPELYTAHLNAEPDPASEPVSFRKIVTPEDAVYDELECEAAQIREREPELTEAQSFVKAMEERPRLYALYLRAVA